MKGKQKKNKQFQINKRFVEPKSQRTMSTSLQIDKITPEELMKLRSECMERLREAKLYELRNDAKLRAVNTTQTYDEFK